MAKKLILAPSVSLNFVGGFVENGIEEVPEEAGLYVVFVCKESATSYNCEQIAYIGKADKTKTSNLRERIRSHISGDFKSWKKLCGMTDEEIFVFAMPFIAMYFYRMLNQLLFIGISLSLIYKIRIGIMEKVGI